MPGSLFWLSFALGALALGLFGQTLPFPPFTHLIWGVAGSIFYLARVKKSGQQISLKVALFVAGSLIVLSLFIYFISFKISSL